MSVRSIEFKVTLEGQGVVQTGNSDTHKMLLNRRVGDLVPPGSGQYNNIKYARGTYRNAEDGKLQKILSISSSCLRHALHEQEMPVSPANAFTDKATALFFSCSKSALLRGWLNVDADNARSSSYCISDAQDESSVFSLEVGSRSGQKQTSTAEESSDTTLFYSEVVGTTKYEAVGSLNISELRFLSFSPVFGRQAISEDDAEVARDLLSASLGSEVDAPRYWLRSGTDFKIPELGIVLNDAQVGVLIKHFFECLARIYIRKASSGYARVTDIKIKCNTPETELGPQNDDLYKTLYSAATGFVPSHLPTELACPWVSVSYDEGVAVIERINAASAAVKAQRDANKATKTSRSKKGKGAPSTPAPDSEIDESV